MLSVLEWYTSNGSVAVRGDQTIPSPQDRNATPTYYTIRIKSKTTFRISHMYVKLRF